MNKVAVLMFMALLMALFVSTGQADTINPAGIDVQEKFDYMGPVVNQLKLSSEKTVAYVDEGEKDWTPVVFVGGAGTAERVMSLIDFARSFRKQLKLRIISVGRNGFGQTEYVQNWGYADYAKEVEEVLAHLGGIGDAHKIITFLSSVSYEPGRW